MSTLLPLVIIAVYVRVSTEEQAKHGYSIEDQIYQCKQQACKDHPNQEIQFILYVDDGFSGEFMERPKLQQLLEDVSSIVVNEVYCYDPDRLARNLMHQLIIDEKISKYMKLIFVNGDYEKTPEGILFFQLRGAIAQFEKAKIKERTTNGRKSKARKGKVVKDVKIYGYNFDKENNKWIINEAEVTIVKFIFNAFLGKIKIRKEDGTESTFQGINGIALYLTDKQIPTKRGATSWHRQVVRQILMQTAYIGQFNQNKWNTEGVLKNKYIKNQEDKVKVKLKPKEEWITVSSPIIIDPTEFYQAQELLSLSRQRWAGTSKNEYLLSGLLRCEHCKNTMTGRKSRVWDTYIFEYTDLKNTAGFKNKGCGLHIKCSKLDESVWELVYQTLINKFKNNIEEIDNDPILSNYDEVEKQRLRKLLETKEKSRKQFIKSIVAGTLKGLSENEINEALMNSQKEIDDINQQLEKIENKLKEKEILQNKDKLLKETIESYMVKDKEEFTFQDKKELIRFVAKEIHLFKTSENQISFKIYGF